MKKLIISLFWFATAANAAHTITVPLEEWLHVNQLAYKMEKECAVGESKVLLTPECMQLSFEISEFVVKYDLDWR